MIISSKVTVGGIEIEKFGGIEIEREFGRLFSLLSIELPVEEFEKISDTLGADIEVSVGAVAFEGFVNRWEKKSNIAYILECRSRSAKMGRLSLDEEIGVYEEATTSLQLCTLYQDRFGIEIVNSCLDIDFEGAYLRKGTPLDALEHIAELSHANIREIDNTIYIEPKRPIPEEGRFLGAGDMVEFVPAGGELQDVEIVDTIEVRNTDKPTTENADMQVIEYSFHIDTDECTGETWVYPHPFGSVESVGLGSLKEKSVNMLQKVTLVDVNFLKTDSEIESIKKITVDGNQIYNFKFDGNIINFSNSVVGDVEVEYLTKCWHGFSRVKNKGSGDFFEYSITYQNQELFFKEIKKKGCGDGDDEVESGNQDARTTTDSNPLVANNQDGQDSICGITTIFPKKMRYSKGFEVLSIGAMLTVSVENDRGNTIANIAPSTRDYALVEGFGDIDSYTPIHPVVRVNGCRANGVDIAYSVASGVVTATGKNKKVRYDTTAYIYKVRLSQQGELTLNISSSLCSEAKKFTLKECDLDDKDCVDCEYPMSIPIDIAKEFKVNLDAVKGKEVGWTDLGDNIGVGTVDLYGILEIPSLKDGSIEVRVEGLNGFIVIETKVQDV